jgi:hypothetical protein
MRSRPDEGLSAWETLLTPHPASRFSSDPTTRPFSRKREKGFGAMAFIGASPFWSAVRAAKELPLPRP